MLAIQHFLKPVPQAGGGKMAESSYTGKDNNNNYMKEEIPTSNNGNPRRPEEADEDLTYIYTNYAERPIEKDTEEAQVAIEPGGEELSEHLSNLHHGLEVFSAYDAEAEESTTASQADENAGAYPSPARRHEIVDAQFTDVELAPGQYTPPAIRTEVVEGELIPGDTSLEVQQPVSVAFREIVEPAAGNMEEVEKVVPKTPEQEAYQTLRGEWLAAKKAHEAAHAAYTEQVKEHYASLQDRNVFLKSWDKIKATVGIKPKLPPEIEAQRSEMFAATGKYNELADKMRQMRSVGKPGKEDYLSTPSLNDPAIQERIAKGEISQDEIRRMKVQDRYFRLLSRSTMMNTFNAQLEAQNEATDNLAIKANGKLLKYRKPLILLGAGVIGAATGGLAAGGIAVARRVAGGAAAAAVTGLLTPSFDRKVEKVTQMADEEFNQVITDYDTRLRSKALTGEEREEIYNELQAILGKVDKAKRDRVLKIMGVAAGMGLLVGAGTGQLMDMFNADSVGDVVVPAKAEINLDGALSGNGSDVPSPVEGGSLEQTLGGYVARPGDNMWDILEGQTEAGKLPFLEQIDPDKLQATLKAVELHLDSNPDLATEIGFRGDPDLLMIGDQVDLAKLNALALEMAEQKGYLIDGSGLSSEVEIPAVEPPTYEIAEAPEVAAVELPDGVALEVEAPTYEIEGDLEGEGNELPPGVELKVEPPTYEIAEGQGAGVYGAGEGVVSTNETTAMLTEKVAERYPTPAAFELDFTKKLVYVVEGKPASGLLSFLSKTPPSVGGFSILEHVDKATLANLELMSDAERLAELDTIGLTGPQYDAWKMYIDQVVVEDEFPANATFGDILKTKYLDGTLPQGNK